MRRLIFPVLSLALVCCGPVPADETPDFKERHDRTWDEVGRLMRDGAREEAGKIQGEFAEECWTYHGRHADTEMGETALISAIKMWHNAGHDRRITESLGSIDPDAAIWYRFLPRVRDAYKKGGREGEYFALFERLKDELTHPLARSQALQSLADDYAFGGRPDRAAEYYRRIIDLAADRVYVDHAEFHLREIVDLAPGMPAPAFRTSDIDGRALSLAELKGKVVLLEFWATFCAPCIPELTRLERLREEHSEDDLAIVGISFDRSPEILKRFLARRPLAWPQLCDGKAGEGEIPVLYNVDRIPRSFVIDRAGKIVAKDHRGDKLDEVLREQIASPL